MMSVPELGIEQLVLRIKVFCRECKEPFIMKTMVDGFSTSEIGLVGDELFVPLEHPQSDYLDETDSEQHPQDLTDAPPPPKAHLH